jgi:hypothetical protein
LDVPVAFTKERRVDLLNLVCIFLYLAGKAQISVLLWICELGLARMQDKRRLKTRPKITKLHQYGKEAGDKHNKPKENQESKTLLASISTYTNLPNFMTPLQSSSKIPKFYKMANLHVMFLGMYC